MHEYRTKLADEMHKIFATRTKDMTDWKLLFCMHKNLMKLIFENFEIKKKAEKNTKQKMKGKKNENIGSEHIMEVGL